MLIDRSAPPHRTRSRTLVLVLTAFFQTSAWAADGLRITSLDVSGAPAIQSPAAKSTAKPSWRTSFGSERDTKPEAAGPVQELDSDIVLLQGVTNLKSLQRAFPGRSWRLIVSRQMVLTDDPVDPRSYEAVSSEPATAIAIRYQAGMRVAGQEHFLGGRSESTGLERLIAGTAARLNIGGRFVWAASLAFTQACATSTCPQREALETWRQEKLASGEAVITGGLRLRVTPAGPAPACPDQTIAISPARKDAKLVLTRATDREGLGCAAITETGQAAAATPSTGEPPQ